MDLGIPLGDFWQMSPRELDAFYRRFVQASEREELLVGILASTIGNFSFSPPKRPLKPSDFGLGPRPARRPRRVTLSDEEIANRWRSYCRQFARPKGVSDADATQDHGA